MQIEIPRKLKPLLYPKRYKGAYGGRGGAKSHFFAEQVILKCYQSPARVVCIREVQNSIKDSVKQLLGDKIAKLNLNNFFEVLESEIRGANGSLIIFKGMQSYNADNIKSLEAYDIAWVEEAQTMSQHSLDLLRPTIRKDGSEIWCSWNPRHKTDPVDQFFRRQPPEDAISVMINWRDNPWFPEVLHKEMDHDFAIDPDKAEHIWNGAYGSSQGAILARWVNVAEREGRINDSVKFDSDGALVDVSSDIGFRDTASWWYWQRCMGGYRLLKYEGDSGLDADDWIPRIQAALRELGCSLGKIWLPHDARAKTFQSRHTTVERFLAGFGAQHVGVVPQSKKADQISAARAVIDQCEFHATNCEAGLDGLRAWEYEWNDDTSIFSREPVHNWASHPSDAFAYGCQVMQMVKTEPAKPAPKFIQDVSLDELWATNKQSTRGRI
ncbi:PBSX family phage terminase large subunit [Nitrosovibrio sp. Nv6]|uniref:PBSX family phage terminase large subunit n=1 Tax=Nitrosovibrio sp. Nv6 TaxID=1855340 RepID=UPI0008C9A245|nr:PBSX family phage terminase large subunit [Nitrosovibrio sp. Nv6]SEO78047.1 phage terminase large subunit [Nitrosovibrio sp. Nv6]